jgi:hypothetical protein
MEKTTIYKPKREALEETNPFPYIDLRLLASGTVRKFISVV